MAGERGEGIHSREEFSWLLVQRREDRALSTHGRQLGLSAIDSDPIIAALQEVSRLAGMLPKAC